jgi:hypothetical protein
MKAFFIAGNNAGLVLISSMALLTGVYRLPLLRTNCPSGNIG